jgi:hypothetical protein
MTEQRKDSRGKALKGGKIVLRGSSIFDCTIRDLSKGGARLRIENTLALPDRFELRYETELGPLRRACRVIWRGPGEVGIAFE